MDFNDAKFALIYFISDKDFSIYSIKEIDNFYVEDFDVIKSGKKLIKTADFDCKPEKVIFILLFFIIVSYIINIVVSRRVISYPNYLTK